jgi:hypothetical protein
MSENPDNGHYDPALDDDYDHDDYDPGEECGRWDQNAKGGMLPYYWCRLAGTEFCDWECPFSSPVEGSPK